jgi:hypothetical protein
MFKFLEEVIKDAAVSKTSNPLMSQVKIEVPEDRYKSDLELHDRFQDFSAELLKLALMLFSLAFYLLSHIIRRFCCLRSSSPIYGF